LCLGAWKARASASDRRATLPLGLRCLAESSARRWGRRPPDLREPIAQGVASTGRIITGAALIIIAVFSGFACGELVMFQ
jgi:hypothetical protein